MPDQSQAGETIGQRLKRLRLDRHMSQGEFASTVSLLEAAVEGEPFFPVERFEIYANLGRAFAGLGQPERAAELFESCLDGVSSAGGDASIEARYATLLSYALSDMGEIG